MRKWLGFFGALLFSGVAVAQTTIVVGVATDSDSTLWTNGTVSAQFVPNPSQPNLNAYRINGAPLSSAVIMQGPISLGSGGNFSITVYDNTQITPSGSQWQFTVCPNAISKCGSVTTSVSGSGQSITTLIDAAIPAPRFPAVAGSYGYASVEAILSTPVGGTFWSVTAQCQEYYNGTSWNCGNLPLGVICTGAGTAQVCTFPGTVAAGTAAFTGPVSAPNIAPVFDVRVYGAQCDGSTDDASAFRATFAAMGATPTGVFYVPNTGKTCRLSSDVEMNLGYPGVPNTPVSTTGNFELRMDGAIRPDAAIGAAIYIHNGWYPVIHFKVDGGGQYGDQALKMSLLVGVSGDIQAKSYLGTVANFIGTGGPSGIQMSNISSLKCVLVGRCLYIYNQIGTGNIVDVEDASPSYASLLNYAGDVSIGHWEGDNSIDTAGALNITNSTSIHLGKIAVGTAAAAAQQILISNSQGVTVDQMLLVGSGATSQNGLLVEAASDFSARFLEAIRFTPFGVLNQGSYVQIDDFYAVANGTHYEMTSQPSGSTIAKGVIHARTSSALTNSYFIDSSLTSGSSLVLSGENSGGDADGFPTYSVENNSTATILFLNSYYDHANNAALVANVGLPVGATNVVMDSASYLDVGISNGSLISGPGVTYVGSVKTNGNYANANGTVIPSTALGYHGPAAGYVQLSVSGATGTITGTALTATCDSGTASVTGAVVGHPVSVSSTTGADVGGAFNVRGSVTATGTVTVYVCGTGTPPSLAYNVTVF